MKFLEAFISMNNKRMDESDVTASVASPAEYIPYFSLALDHLQGFIQRGGNWDSPPPKVQFPPPPPKILRKFIIIEKSAQ